jgi:hypothetical protein
MIVLQDGLSDFYPHSPICLIFTNKIQFVKLKYEYVILMTDIFKFDSRRPVAKLKINLKNIPPKIC